MTRQELNLLNKLDRKISRLESILLGRMVAKSTMTSKEAAAYLGIAVSTLNKISCPDNMVIPCSKSGGKNKVFFKKDLDLYLETTKATVA